MPTYPSGPNTAYVNTIPVTQQKEYPGDRALERRIEAYLRWNSVAMVLKANKISSEFGGHLASYASSATLYEVGFKSFLARGLRAASGRHGVHAGTLLAGHLRACVSGRSAV